MEENAKGDKVVRVLQLYAKLMDGCVVNKTEEARFYGVNERSIQRDIDDIRNFLDADAERTGVIHTVAYDREKKGYRLDAMYRMSLTNSEVLALCKILLDSRAFTKQEMVGMLDKLITAKVLDEADGVYTVEAEARHSEGGSDTWQRSQGSMWRRFEIIF